MGCDVDCDALYLSVAGSEAKVKLNCRWRLLCGKFCYQLLNEIDVIKFLIKSRGSASNWIILPIKLLGRLNVERQLSNGIKHLKISSSNKQLKVRAEHGLSFKDRASCSYHLGNACLFPSCERYSERNFPLLFFTSLWELCSSLKGIWKATKENISERPWMN